MKKLVLLSFLVSCAGPAIQKLSPAVYYKNDLCFTYKEKTKKRIYNRNGRRYSKLTYEDKKEFCGVGVLPEKDRYKIKVEASGKLDFFSLTTCHEETTTQRPDKGIFRRDGVVTIDYIPTLEKELKCPLFVSAYNKKQRHGWGIITFENSDYILDAEIDCNGYEMTATGVSICQSREGLAQRISFNEPVKLVDPVSGASDRKNPCPEIGKDGQKEYIFDIPNRECIYGFIGIESGNIHQLYTVGYEEIIIRN